MKKVILLSTFLALFYVFCFSQDFEILNQNPGYSFEKSPKEFYFISKDLNSSKGTKVADIKFYAKNKGEKVSLVPVFYSLWKNANKLGANSFFISEITYNDDEKRHDITVELFFLNDNEIDENLDLYPKNLIVIIGNVNTSNAEKGTSFKLNKEAFTLYPFQYITCQNDIGEKANIQVGGVIGGTSVSIKGEENKLPQFFSLGGVSISPAIGIAMGSGGTGMGGGISFRTGSVFPVDMNLGLFLMEILKNE